MDDKDKCVIKIVIVRDMWPTGFDVPLMQIIARVNRVFRDKPGGLIVDYICISDSLKEGIKSTSV